MENLKIEPGLFREVMTMSLRSLTNVEVTVDSSGGRSTNYNEMEYQKSQKIQDFFLLMAICNTVVVTTHAHEDLVGTSQSFDRDTVCLSFSHIDSSLLIVLTVLFVIGLLASIFSELFC